MQSQISTKAIVLHRTNYGEADRIITSITSDGIKISLFAKGVRKPKSKLVAGTELFCVSDICYIQKSPQSMATLVSAKIHKQHASFLNDLSKVQLAYDVIKLINKHTEDIYAEDYYIILKEVLSELDSKESNVDIVRAWAWLKILSTSGHQLQLQAQSNGEDFKDRELYIFDWTDLGFINNANGQYSSEHIKFLMVCQGSDIKVINRIKNGDKYAKDCIGMLNQFVETTY
jgi:DNA repair protein RecO (recombination protein O)